MSLSGLTALRTEGVTQVLLRTQGPADLECDLSGFPTSSPIVDQLVSLPDNAKSNLSSPLGTFLPLGGGIWESGCETPWGWGGSRYKLPASGLGPLHPPYPRFKLGTGKWDEGVNLEASAPGLHQRLDLLCAGCSPLGPGAWAESCPRGPTRPWTLRHSGTALPFSPGI